MKQLKCLLLFLLVFAFVTPIFVACSEGTNIPGDSSAPEESSGSPVTIGDPSDAKSKLPDQYWPEYDNFDDYAEMRETLENWLVSQYIEGKNAPFSFIYNGLPSSLFLSKWKRSTETSEDENAKYYTVRYTGESEGLCVWSEFVLYKDYPTLEWCTYAKNIGDSTSKTLKEFLGMNVKLALDSEEPVLHTTEGSLDIAGDDLLDFQLITQPLSDKKVTYHPELEDGRSSEHAFPFFDIVGENNGLMVGIGWTGIWKASFSANQNVVSMTSGMYNLNTVLYADEEIRTPLYSITYFDGDAEFGHNLFRKTVLAHYTPDDGSEDVCKLPISVTTESYGENDIIADVSKWVGKLAVDTVWTDAAWFGNVDTDPNGWATQTGNWWINTRRYPSGSLQKVSNFLHENDKKYVVWFEPERVAAGTMLQKDYSNLLMSSNIVGSYLLDLASEDAYQWVFSYLSEMIEENGIDVYRQDFNSPGLARAWAANDEDGRQGMTEMRYVENMYRLFDALREKFPGLMIDNCASGGKRIDLEMLKRSVVLHRTDYTCVPYGDNSGNFNFEGIQYQNQNLSYWLPLHGSSVGYPVYLFEDSYMCRSLLAPGVGLGIQIGYAADNLMAQKLTKELSDFRGYMIGNYYSLLTPSYDKADRQAFMYFRDDLNEGLLLVYNRPDNQEGSRFNLKLKGLDPDSYYAVLDCDALGNPDRVKSGRELMEDGLTVNVYAGTAKVFRLLPVS